LLKRQRCEIKVYAGSDENLKIWEDDTIIYEEEMLIPQELGVSYQFLHFFQILPVGTGAKNPVISLTAAVQCPSDISALDMCTPLFELRLRPKVDEKDLTAAFAKLDDLRGELVKITLRATFSNQGSVELLLTRVSDNAVLIDWNGEADTWRGSLAGDFSRIKLGMYRSFKNRDALHETDKIYRKNIRISKIRPVVQ
jgi:hypothetical protein